MKIGKTGLLIAAEKDRWDIVTKLIDSGATDVDAANTANEVSIKFHPFCSS